MRQLARSIVIYVSAGPLLTKGDRPLAYSALVLDDLKDSNFCKR